MTNLVKGLTKGIIITTVSVPLILIGMNVTGRMLDRSKNKPKKAIKVK